MKIYTKTGDAGQTSLVGGQRVNKTHARLEAYGTIDELNSYVGLCISSLRSEMSLSQNLEKVEEVLVDLSRLQHKLFNTGSLLACEDGDLAKKLPQIQKQDIEWMELAIDEAQKKLSPLKEFILPGGSQSSSHFQVARTIARRAERCILRLFEGLTDDDPLKDTNTLVLAFVNRTSDYLFVLARLANFVTNTPEVRWKKDL